MKHLHPADMAGPAGRSTPPGNARSETACGQCRERRLAAAYHRGLRSHREHLTHVGWPCRKAAEYDQVLTWSIPQVVVLAPSESACVGGVGAP